MNRNDLYNSFQKVDDDILERSETAIQVYKKPVWLKWSPMAAGLFLAAAIGLTRFLPADPVDAPAPLPTPAKDLPVIIPDEPDVNPYGNTSDTYTALPELLAYLSSHDTHGDEMTNSVDGSISSSVQAESAQTEKAILVENTGVAVDTTGEYSYHIGEACVHISRLDGENTENVGNIDTSADAIFICNNNLLVLSRYQSGGDELNREMSVRINIYDITAPRAPVLLDEYTQLGDLTACWMSGANLYFITGDGMCACGWSRLADPSKYYPSLARNGRAVEWSDDDISILGEPTRVQYSAVTIINGNSREVISKKALYGNIQNLFYGNDWIAAVAAGETAILRENPIVYTFDSSLHFTGKIITAQIVNVPETNVLKDYTPQNGTYLKIASLTKKDSIYHMLGTCSIQDEEGVSSYFLAIAADMETGEAESRLLSAENYPHGTFTEIIWEENRAVSCIGVRNNTMMSGIQKITRFLFTEFNGLDISFHENRLTADYLNCRVGVMYGNPFGEFRTLIPMGNGIYVRYSNPDEDPGGFDMFDFSDSSAPSCLYSSDVSLSGDDAFDYAWYIYDSSTFGTLKVLLGADDHLRNVRLSWCIYTIDATGETSITLQKESFLDEEVKIYFGADALGFTVFHVGDNVYYITKKRSSAALLR